MKNDTLRIEYGLPQISQGNPKPKQIYGWDWLKQMDQTEHVHLCPQLKSAFDAFDILDDAGPAEGPDNRMVLTIHQPWAFLIVNGIKDIENRSRKFSFTGKLWIHAGQKIDIDMIPVLQQMGIPVPDAPYLQTSGIVGVTYVKGCHLHHDSKWFNGPWGLVLDPKQSRPICFEPMRGFQGLWLAGRGRK